MLMFALKLLNVGELNFLYPKHSIFWIFCIFRYICYILVAYSEPIQPSKFELYQKAVNA